ncbi:fructosamine kinase family protein [Pseudoalteromonas phenolica]|uniref:Fructosamine kinase family protein n=1 Tax=Pseudoalteromonas phenolica TaxID=161398 RepID=A0A5S3YS38_9GAMM|nr:fructosamine kinase family protein [Pseudoalteromonas phenolica]TMN86550.1 fructosamine kinase family protein [Pseudoalteromonas phenolica]TMP79065.1 fructosamine kinase family protein [Pseudoalteromonas phenolica]
MWQCVKQQVSEAIHTPFELTNKQLLNTHSSFKHFKIHDSKHEFLVKVAPIEQFELFETEANARDLLTRDSDFVIADTVTLGKSKEFAFLVLEYLEDLDSIDNWYLCGRTLAKMHVKCEQQMFGSDEDNFVIGQPQPNQWHKKWHVFFAEERLGWQLQLLDEQNTKLVDIDEFIQIIKPHIPHHVSPSLLHGHFWKGNIKFYKGKPMLLDPASYYGDKHVDIATAELFATMPDSFYSGYQSVSSIELSPMLRDIYQLYPLLLLANRFAGDYLNQAKAKIKHILEQI